MAEIGNNERQLSAEEFAEFYESKYKQNFKTKKQLLDWYAATDSTKFPVVDFLAEHIRSHKYKSVLSLGAGPCVLEYMLKEKLPDTRVVATDFNPFFVNNAKRLFPSITVAAFDFFKDGNSCLKEFGVDFDIAVFFGSSYVMDDDIFIRQFSGLHELGVKSIIDFQAGYLPLRNIPRTLISRILRLGNANGKFHGYCRTKGELRRLYLNSGYACIEEKSIGNYEYVAIISE